MNLGSFADRALIWARRRPARVGGHNPWEVTVRVVRATVDDRVTGLAAEMAFFAVLSLVPLLVATGAALGYLERLIGQQAVSEAEQQAIRLLDVVFSGEFTEGTIAPLVRGLLSQERGGIALSSLLVTLWLASRVFSATIRALDLAYDVEERRNLVQQRLLAVGFALAAVVVVALVLTTLVVGPLFGGGRTIADRLGFGEVFALAWSLGRWPALFVVGVLFLAGVYRFGPNVRNTWREALPGAVLGVTLWLLATIGFRLYLEAGGGTTDIATQDEAVAVLGRMVGSLVAGVLWTYLSGVSILVGGELNAELAFLRAERESVERTRGRVDV